MARGPLKRQRSGRRYKEVEDQMNTLSIRTDPFRYMALQYLLIAFSRLRVRGEALGSLDDLLSYLAAEPEAALPEGGTCGQLALAYLHDLQAAGRHAEYDFRWLRGDRQLQSMLEHYRDMLEPAAPSGDHGSTPTQTR